MPREGVGGGGGEGHYSATANAKVVKPKCTEQKGKWGQRMKKKCGFFCPSKYLTTSPILQVSAEFERFC